METELWKFWQNAQKMNKVDLTHPLDNNSPYWAGMPERSVELGKVIFDWGNPMLECRIQSFRFPGQFGTHIDFPAHFVKGGDFAESFGPECMMLPLCVIDISAKVSQNCEYAVTVEDIKEWEAANGPVPQGAFVALRTDWGRNWPDMEALSGSDANGGEHFPGWSLPALKYIYEVRGAAANGHETLDTDASAEAAKAGDLACERYVLANGHFQVELLCNLDKVPAAGALIFLGWPDFKGANGLPVRAWALF